MNAFGEFRDASVGWLDRIAARAGAAEKFNLSRAGLINATGCYFVLVLLTLVVQVAAGGFPGWLMLVLGILINTLPLLALWAVIWATAKMLTVSAIGLMVPTTYAMGFILLIGLPLSLIAGEMFGAALLGALGFMFYRAARAMGKLNVSLSLAFAIVSILALVAMPLGLYMLTTQGRGIG